MHVTEIPEDVVEKWETKGYLAANHCFANCSRLVFQLPAMNLGYVLCWVEIKGKKYSHAVISCKKSYFDPTLQKSNGLRKYEFIREYSRVDLIDAMVNGGGNYDDETGTMEGLPPALHEDGTISCVAVSLPGPQA